MPGDEPVHVDPGNTEAARSWEEEGAFWAQNAERFDRGITAHHGPFLEAAGIEVGHHVLDIGCGCGQTTIEAARAASPSGSALGVDLSSPMLAVARRRAADEGLTHASFELADAQVHAFEPATFDLAISRAGTLFFSDPVRAFANIGRALRGGGTLTMLTWQPPDLNEWFTSFRRAMAAGRDLPMPPPDAPGPYSLSEPDRVGSILTAAGFIDVELHDHRARMWFGDRADEAYEFVLEFLGWMLHDLDDAGRDRARDALRTTMAEHEGPDGVTFGSATWFVTARKA